MFLSWEVKPETVMASWKKFRFLPLEVEEIGVKMEKKNFKMDE